MLVPLFLVLTGFVAYQSKPKQETFVPFLTSQRKSRLSVTLPPSLSGSTVAARVSGADGAAHRQGGGVSGWFTRNILEPLTGPRIPEHTITDCYIFYLATLNDGSGQYLGMFQKWWVVSELQEVSDTTESGPAPGNGGVYEAQAEGQKQDAVQAKIKKDYLKAARAYVEAAKLYEKSGSQFNLMEAAGAYEDAYKTYNMAKQSGLAIQCLENAARLFHSNERGGLRAAKAYNQLGDLLKGHDAKKAAEMYREAAELFKTEGDGRALYATIRQVEQLCILQDYAQAFALYSDTIIPETMAQDILRYTTRDHILNAVIAHLGATKGDWILFEKDLKYFEDVYPDFQMSRSDAVLKSLARTERENDAVAFQNACQELNRLHTGGMPDWQVGLLLKEKKKLEDGNLL
ncbi:soluble NSF attachment protein [Gamsiella multidivaricata]|uniref:soluble NSF attachment protein n=1 Tax=Gamsiella multidivaricata TaxID=101098 RepID=UPI00221FEF2E|nr:soluble NSF attachment protein [Gamsiella multidivaricata]KAG0357808.1 hypothetical protein BGZ54_000181 [Gamsiella multidivaricata]KAI7819709.1 soluble NSF attachment protein [Gamsiella multidivaricata]